MLPAARHREAITESLISEGRVPEGPGAEWSQDPDSNFHVPGSGRTQNAKMPKAGILARYTVSAVSTLALLGQILRRPTARIRDFYNKEKELENKWDLSCKRTIPSFVCCLQRGFLWWWMGIWEEAVFLI